jgi:hypothetical protein
MNTKIKISIASLCLGMLIVVGCKKDSSSPSVKMSAKIDNVAWNSTLRVTVKNDKGFVITGTQVSPSFVSSSLVIQIFGYSTGTYNVLALSNNCAADYSPNTSISNSFLSVSGTVNLTEVNTSNKTISGTFSFICTNLSQTFTITDGSFNGLIYTESTGN